MAARPLPLLGAAVSALLVLTGCGGGGGGGDGGGGGGNLPLTLTVSPNPITASIAQIDLPSSVMVNASVQGTISATMVYVIIADPAGTFSGTTSLTQSAATQYQASLTLSNQLTIGTHSGTLQISICGDLQCTSLYGRTTAPYSITITENPVLTGTWSQASVTLAAVSGDTEVDWPLTLTTPNASYIPFASFSDAAHVLQIAGNSQTIVVGSGAQNLKLTVSPNVAPGTYSGTLNVAYCRDSACKQMYRGVTQLPYTVAVYAASNLTPLAALAGAADWQGVQGSPAHTGYVPVTLSAGKFSQRWRWQSPDAAGLPYVLPPVTSGGKVFTMAAPDPTVHSTPILFAIDEATGTPAWQQPVPDTDTGTSSFGLGPLVPPAIAGGNVYVARTVGTMPPQNGQFSSFRVADGTSPFAPQSFTDVPGQYGDYFYMFPGTYVNFIPVYMTPRNDTMLLAVGGPSGNSFVGFDPTSGTATPQWPSCAAATGNTSFGGTAAVDANGTSYLVTTDGLLVADTCESISAGLSLADGNGPAVVPGTSDVIAVGDGNLVDFDTATSQVKWSAPKSGADVFVNNAAVTGPTVYVQNSGRVQLEARNESTGQILWTWQSPWNDTAFYGNVVATANLVILSTTQHVYAIDTTTHNTVWIYPYPAKQLAVSANGVLYLRRVDQNTGDESLVAINLQ
jgi:hypothetical protein